MQKDERDLLDVLKFELAYLEKGGYGSSPRNPWMPQFIFEDSPTCMNYDTKDHREPCSSCVLMQLVPPAFRDEQIPCRHIPFNVEGETLDSLYRYAPHYETEEIFGKWLHATIAKLETDRQAHQQGAARGDTVNLPVPLGSGETKGEALFHNLHPKCANAACTAAFHWLGGGKFYRFQPNAGDPGSEMRSTNALEASHGVKHYWLCESCTHVYGLGWDANQGVVLKLLRPELPRGGSSKELTAA